MNGFVQKAAFTYLNDSRPQEMDNQVNASFNRDFKFDSAGRLTANNFGAGSSTVPYSQTINYDAFSQITNRTTTHWSSGNGFTAAFVNGRKQPHYSQTPVYDASGNMLSTGTRSPLGQYQGMKYDAANRQSESITKHRAMAGRYSTITYITSLGYVYDGDGRMVKQTRTTYRAGTTPPSASPEEFQIWSSVLGSALTLLKPDGTKQSTKIFAGGAVIAVQADDWLGTRVEWISADPVTGSSVSIKKTGAFADYDRKELEALGQEVSPTEPPVESPSEPNPVSVNTADEGEWLCGLRYNSFFDKPVHCQISEMTGGNVDLKALFSSKTENNPHNISAAPSGTGPAGDRPVNLTATNKPQDGSSAEGSPVDESQIPNQDGKPKPPKLKRGRNLSPEELSIKRAVAATGIYDDEGTQESRILNNSISNMKDASYSGTRIIDSNFPSAGDIRGKLVKVDEDMNCRALIYLIFEELKRRGQDYRSTSLAKVFDSVKVLEVNPKQAPSGGFTLAGKNRQSHGATSVRQSDGGYIRFNKNMGGLYLGNTIGELIHLARANNDYTDEILDQAVTSVIGTKLAKQISNDIKKSKAESDGNLAHRVINNGCFVGIENARFSN